MSQVFKWTGFSPPPFCSERHVGRNDDGVELVVLVVLPLRHQEVTGRGEEM